MSGAPQSSQWAPGQIIVDDADVAINADKEVTEIEVTNTGDRPVQVGSHFHFAEVNPALDFDRSVAWGKHLNVLAGNAVRFEPGATEHVELVPFGGLRIARGFRGECGGALDV